MAPIIAYLMTGAAQLAIAAAAAAPSVAAPSAAATSDDPSMAAVTSLPTASLSNLGAALQPTQTNLESIPVTYWQQIELERLFASSVTSIPPAQITQIHDDLAKYYSTYSNSASSGVREARSSLQQAIGSYARTASDNGVLMPHFMNDLESIVEDVANKPTSAVLAEASSYFSSYPFASQGMAYVTREIVADAPLVTGLRNIITSDLSLQPSSTLGTSTTKASGSSSASSMAKSAAEPQTRANTRLTLVAVTLATSLFVMALL